MSQKEKPSSIVKLTLIKLLLKIVVLLPFSVVRKIGALTGYLTWLSKSRTVKITLINISICLPFLTVKQQKQLAKQSCIHSGMVFFESLWLWQQSNEKVAQLIQFSKGKELLEKAESNGRGILFTGAHLGNWEALLAWGGINYKAGVMYRMPKVVELDNLLRSAREKTGVELIVGERQSVRQMLKLLKDGKKMMMLSDQRPAPNGGVFAPFFGHPAYTMVIVQRLIQKTNSQLLFFYAKRTKKGFEIIVEDANFNTSTEDAEVFASGLNNMLKKQILDAPEQFEWSYRRFRPQPEGSPVVY